VYGFTLIELMVVVAIIAFLGVIGIPSYLRFVAKSKRTEAYLNLGAIYAAQKAYWAEHGTYTDKLTGSDGIGWSPEGKIQYSYGFPGTQGVNFIQGSAQGNGQIAGIAHADAKGFVAVAIGDIDGDGQSDIITIDDKHQLKIVQDDLS
jgi:type IV pilus assembly protein PilA